MIYELVKQDRHLRQPRERLVDEEPLSSSSSGCGKASASSACCGPAVRLTRRARLDQATADLTRERRAIKVELVAMIWRYAVVRSRRSCTLFIP
jgi:hypothetical protein